MINLLYIGNNLKQNQRSNTSVMDTLGPLFVKEGYSVKYASSKASKMLRLVDMLTSVLKHRDTTDLVLIDTYSTQNFYYAFLVSQLCRRLKLPYVPILHGGLLPNRLLSHPLLSRMIFQNARANVAPSLYLKEAFQAKGYKVVYIPNTLHIPNYPFTHGEFSHAKLLWVRSFSKIYNPNLAVQVLNGLKKKGLDANLCMVGPDSDGSLQEVKNLARQLEVEVKFTGKLTKQEWMELSKHYNIFINTTNIDNMPVSVIEAMALGLPVVSTNVGGMPYLINSGTNGILVEKDNVDSMCNAIIQLIQNPALRIEITENARKLAESFDWEVVKLKWQKVLR